MRRHWMVLATALGLVQTAAAEPAAPYKDDQGHLITPPRWIKTPSERDMASFFPVTATREGGQVKVRCVVTVRTTLDDCQVIEESPLGHGLGAAALMATSQFQMQPKLVDGVPVGGATVVIPFNFRVPTAPYKDDQGHVITPPRWIKTPSARDMENFFPATATRDGGQVRVRCIVTVRTTLDDCQVIEESPPDHGLGAAALMATSMFQMQPKLVDGVPVGGAPVVIPFNFSKSNYTPNPEQTHKVTRSAAWSATPTAAEMAAAFPARALGKSQSGRVVLRCGLTRDGRLTSCDTVSEEPTGLGFSAAARGLTKRFHLISDPDYLKQIADYNVDVSFDFHDPGLPAQPLEMHDPTWLQTADPNMAGQLFPEEAAKAGLKTGRAILVCRAAHDGALTGCAVEQEEPPGLGFGQAALAIAGVMKMNPWTAQGDPVDDAKIRLPIRVNAKAPAAAASAPQP